MFQDSRSERIKMDAHRNLRSCFVPLILASTTLIWLASREALQGGCAPPSSGIVSWWPAEGNAVDVQGTNNGTFTNPAYGFGEVGQAFSFDGSGNNVRVPAAASLDVGTGNGLT